jgi:tRNA (mo5U34)-methyltransferase
MTDDEIRAKIESFPVWHYRFDLRGHRTPIFDPGHVNRHAQREAYFFRPLVDLCGGSLRGRRVLDLGCNAGYWSLLAAEAGCDFVLGIDGRPEHVDQSNFVFEVKGIDRSRYEFRAADIYDALGRDLGRFDVVLCLGLLYHVSEPMRLLDLISRVNDDLLVIDTALSPMLGSVLEVRSESVESPRNALDRSLVLVPTREAVRAMVRQFGYQVESPRPGFSDYTGAYDYLSGERRAFFCSKRSPLSSVEDEGVDSARPVHRMKGIRSSEIAGVLVSRALRRISLSRG